MDGTIGLGATSIDKIGEVQLSDEIGVWGGLKLLTKLQLLLGTK